MQKNICDGIYILIVLLWESLCISLHSSRSPSQVWRIHSPSSSIYLRTMPVKSSILKRLPITFCKSLIPQFGCKPNSLLKAPPSCELWQKCGGISSWLWWICSLVDLVLWICELTRKVGSPWLFKECISANSQLQVLFKAPFEVSPTEAHTSLLEPVILVFYSSRTAGTWAVPTLLGSWLTVKEELLSPMGRILV